MTKYTELFVNIPFSYVFIILMTLVSKMNASIYATMWMLWRVIIGLQIALA